MTAPTTRRKPASSCAAGGQHAPAQAHRQAYQRRKTRAKAKSEALRQSEAAQLEALPVLRPHACGIDIGSRSHWVCVGFATEADSCLTREFPAHTDGLKAIVAFLREHQVNTVAMESTGIYWIATVRVARGRGVRGAPGRSQLQPPAARTPQDGPPRLPVDLPAALRRPAGRGLSARRADLPAAGLPAAAGQPGPLRPAGTCSTCRRPWSR